LKKTWKDYEKVELNIQNNLVLLNNFMTLKWSMGELVWITLYGHYNVDDLLKKEISYGTMNPDEREKTWKENHRMMDMILMIMNMSNDIDQFDEMIQEKGIEQGLFD